MFDDLLLLSEGRVMYAGPSDKMVDYFSRFNFVCPELSNPADFMFMAILNNEIELPQFAQKLDSNEKQETNQARINRLLEQWPNSPESRVVLAETANIPSAGIPQKSYKTKSTWFTQFSYLLARASKNAFRNPFIVRAKFFQTVFLGLIIGNSIRGEGVLYLLC